MAVDRSWMFRWAAYSQGAQFLINFVASVVVARLLGPADLGAYSVAMAAVILAQVLRLAGINSFLIQEAELTKPKVAGAFGLACGFGAALGLLIILIRHHVAEFYGSPAIADVLLISGCSYFVAPLQIIGIGIRTRNLEIARIAFAAVGASIAGAGTSILLALAGHGAVSLAWGELAGSLLSSLIIWWRPPALMRTLPSFGGWSSIWRISGWSLGSSILSQVGGRSSEMVIGKTLGIDQAALFDRGEMLPRLVWNYIAPPVLHLLAPMLASDVRAGHSIRDLTRARLRLFACIFGPALAALATQSQPLLLILYGEQWSRSVEPAEWLCLSSALIGQFVVINAALIAMGRTRELFAITAVEQVARLIILLLLGQTDIELIAAGMLAAAAAYAAAAVFVARRAQIMGIRDLAVDLRPGLVCFAAVFATGHFSLWIAGWLTLSLLVTLMLGGLMTAAAWILTLFIVERDVLRAVWRILVHRQPRL